MKSLLLLLSTAYACNVYNSNYYTNTNLCLGELCSVNGYANSCASGCCTGSYCKNQSACSVAIWIPVVMSLAVLSWVAFIIFVAYKRAEIKRALLLGNKRGEYNVVSGSVPTYNTEAINYY